MDELTAFRSLRSLEDLSEEEIARLEEIIGYPIRRPTEVGKAQWKEFKKQYRLNGKWKFLPFGGRRTTQEPLEQLWNL